MKSIMLLILAGACAAACQAGFDAKLQGNVSENGRLLKGATIKVIPDPLWGRANEKDFETYRKENGPLPTIEVTGTGTSDDKGSFKFSVAVIERDGNLPKRKGGKDGKTEVSFIYAIVIAEAGDFRPERRGVLLEANAEQNMGTITLQMATWATGKVVKLSDRKPLAGMKIKVFAPIRPGVPVEITVETDKDGKFEIGKDVCPLGVLTISSLDPQWAFANTSTAWSGIRTTNGANDLGTFVVVPGGSIKFSPVDVDTKKTLAVNVQVTGAEKGSQVRFSLAATEAAVIVPGLPEGIFQIVLTFNGYWQTLKTNIEVEGGKQVDLGEVTLEPHRSLNVIAVSDDNKGIERYRATVTLLEGKLPPDLQHYGGNRTAYSTAIDLTAERDVVSRLFSGKWTVQVSADGYAAGVVTIDLPRTEPVTVTLEQGGSIEYELFDMEGRAISVHSVFAVNQTSPEYKKVLEQNQKYQLTQPPPVGVYQRTQQGGDLKQIANIPAGDYLVVANDWGNYLTQDNVKVEKGKLTSIKMKPKLGSLTVKVTDKGVAKSGEEIVVLSGQLDWQPTISEYKTDSKGEIVLADLKPAAFMVLRKREYDWAKTGGQPYEIRQRLEPYKVERERQISLGVHETIEIKLDDPGFCWFTVELLADTGMTPDAAALVEKIENRAARVLVYNARYEAGKYVFGRVKHGTYSFSTSGRLNDGNMVTLSRELKIDLSPDHTTKLDWDLSKLTIKVKLPKGAERNSVMVYVRPPANGQPQSFRSDRYGVLDDKDQCVFVAVAEGSYDVVVIVNKGSMPQYVVSQRIEVKGNATETVKVDDKVGNLKVRVVGSPALGGSRNSEALARIFLYDAKGVEVAVGNPDAAVGTVNREWIIYSVPVGTFRAVIKAHGLQPFEVKELKVKKGEETAVTANSSAAAVAIVTLKNFTWEDLQSSEPKWELEDENGNPLPSSSPDGKACFVLDMRNNDMQLVIINIPPEAKKARMVANGYEDVSIDVDGSAGKTNLADLTLTPKTD